MISFYTLFLGISASLDDISGVEEGHICMHPPAMFVLKCADGLTCSGRHVTSTGDTVFTCEKPRLGASGHVSPVNGPCGCNGNYDDPCYTCEQGLECIPPTTADGRPITGSYGTCGQPNLGEHIIKPILGSSGPAQQGEGCACDACGPTGNFRRECAAGLQCVSNPFCVPPCVDDGYKTCQPVNLGSALPPPSNVGERCGENGTEFGTRYYCKTGLVCVQGIPGAYGICEEPELGSALPPPSNVGERCGENGTQFGTRYYCKTGLVCVQGIPGSYGICEEPQLGSALPPPSNVGQRCGSDGTQHGTHYYCKTGLTCVQETPGAYGICEQPVLGVQIPYSESRGYDVCSSNTDCPADMPICYRSDECPECMKICVASIPLGSSNDNISHTKGDEGPELGVPAPVDSPIIVVFLTDPVTGETYSSKAKVAPALGSSNDNISQEGGKCGYNGVYQAPVFTCASGLTCQHTGLYGSYGTCVSPTLGASNEPMKIISQEGGRCGSNGVYQAPVYVCDSGLECERPGRVGAYGTCRFAPLGASNPVDTPIISQEGGRCGSNGVYQAPVYVCASGLACQSSGLDGAYGTCTAPSLGETRHAQEGEGCACESCGPEAWSIPCASGLVCVGNTFEHGDDFVDDGYKTCQKPSLGASGGCWSDNGCPHGEYCLGAGMLIMGVPQMGTCHA